MTEEVKRSYLEINSLKDLQESKKPSDDYIVNLIEPTDFQLNKFFYKNIGKKHKWIDRLIKLIQILARADRRTNRGTSRGSRGPKKTKKESHPHIEKMR